MHTYIRTNNNGDTLYVVGHYLDATTWRALGTFTIVEDATAWVSYLNGGTYPADLVSEVQS